MRLEFGIFPPPYDAYSPTITSYVLVVADGFTIKPLKQLATTLPYQTGGEGTVTIVKG